MLRLAVIGNVGKDPEVSFAKESGTTLCKFSVATSKKIKGEEKTQWINVTCFGKTAENVGQYLKKGREVYVDGDLEVREYVTKEGKAGVSVDLAASQVKFLRGGTGDAKTPEANKQNSDNIPF